MHCDGSIVGDVAGCIYDCFLRYTIHFTPPTRPLPRKAVRPIRALPTSALVQPQQHLPEKKQRFTFLPLIAYTPFAPTCLGSDRTGQPHDLLPQCATVTIVIDCSRNACTAITQPRLPLRGGNSPSGDTRRSRFVITLLSDTMPLSPLLDAEENADKV